MLENQLAGGNSSGIKIYDYENPLGTVIQIFFENQLVGRQDFKIRGDGG
jgi:hypothetical protein